ncbi:glycoside hydrolase family 53 protein [Serpula lacrymans var. lacrymans S7.3]|uniref:Arabinogalactan endo-beta-1,4-galactanase n=2 Tax=Serpula lacrymans var. lacrymans TaxID=341189 RepID=F8PKC9_SERL3|nr:glycoside hydrolase family 53 protein [Serpula lacrymans var. lacrymans S7.9]EGO03843.1 glycoside hydrolase family 53 protein [Serpula lacrymans var. lacrymans S7.3]EGO29769.1 glycoside hydrolase family 53 protein [Serpula lacrymans var. lacrymans S7.9]
MLSPVLLTLIWSLGFVLQAFALPYHGADFSSLLLLESTTNVTYSSPSSPPQPFETILADYGTNLARIRIWTASTYDLPYGLALAKRAQAAGMDLLIDLHYDDTWADAGHQAIPSGWPTDLEGLTAQVYNYTKGLVTSFNEQGTPIQFIQIGNEINDGLLWPTGQISVNGFGPASELLHAGVLAVRSVSPTTKTVIHLANGWDEADVAYFYGGIFNVSSGEEGLGGGLQESDVDAMGFSYYPFYGTDATLTALTSSMESVIGNYSKNVMVVETDWPAVCNTTATPLSEPTIPVSVAGQEYWVQDINDVLDGINLLYPDKAIGIVYWEPGWIGNAALGSGCADTLLVTSTGEARESMSMFGLDM